MKRYNPNLFILIIFILFLFPVKGYSQLKSSLDLPPPPDFNAENSKKEIQNKEYITALGSSINIKHGNDGIDIWTRFLKKYPKHLDGTKQLALWKDRKNKTLYEGVWITKKEINTREEYIATLNDAGNTSNGYDGIKLWTRFLKKYPKHLDGTKQLALWKDRKNKTLYEGVWLTKKEIADLEKARIEEKERVAKKEEEERIAAEKRIAEEKQKEIDSWGMADITVLVKGNAPTPKKSCEMARFGGGLYIDVDRTYTKRAGYNDFFEADKETIKNRNSFYRALETKDGLRWGVYNSSDTACERDLVFNETGKNISFIKEGQYNSTILRAAWYRGGIIFFYYDYNVYEGTKWPAATVGSKLTLKDDMILDIKRGQKLVLSLSINVSDGSYNVDKRYERMSVEEKDQLVKNFQ